MAKPSPQLLEIEGLRTVFSLGIMVTHLAQFMAGSLKEPETGHHLEERLFRSIFGGHGTGMFVGTSIVDFFFIIAGFVSVWVAREGGTPLGIAARLVDIATKCARLLPCYWIAQLGYILIRTPDIHPLSAFLAFFGLQSWFPVFDGRMYLPMVLSSQLWFVSSLMGAFVIFGLFGSHTLRYATTPHRNLLLIIAFSVMRMLCHLLAQSHTFLASLKATPVLHWANDIFNGGWLLHWPPAVATCFFAGAHTAQLVKQLPSDSGVRAWRVWMFLDLPLWVLWVAGMMWSIGGVRPVSSLSRFFGADGAILSSNEFQAIYCLSLFMTCCTHKGMVFRAISHPCFVVFAPLSYGAYCFHYDVIWLLQRRGWNPSSMYTHCAYFTLTWLLAGLYVQFVESPLRQLAQQWKGSAGEKDSASSKFEHHAHLADSVLSNKQPSEATPLRQSV